LLLTEWFFTTFEYKSLFLPFHDQVPLILEREIAIIITKEVGFAGLGSIRVCHIFKMKSKPVKLIKISLCGFFIFRQDTFKDLPVFQKRVVDGTDKRVVVIIGFLLIVKIIAAIIITKLLITSSLQPFATGKTKSVFQ